MPVGQLILEIRGCIFILNRSDLFKLDSNFVREQITRAERLVKLYRDTKPSNFDLVQRSWLKDGRHDFIDLSNLLLKLKSYRSFK
jgi:hypothetical protein